MMKISICGVFIIAFLYSCKHSNQESIVEHSETVENPTNRVLLSSEIVWEKLNPARGDQSPQAGTIWGDRKRNVATGFLAKFVDGFSSPPHIHNITYRAVVINGLVHNDDPQAEKMWMSKGSFWTQPLGEPHITSAKGTENIALVEIDSGPYLVKPIDEAFDNGERAVNIDASNIVWLNNKKTKWISSNCKAEISFLLENKGFRSLFFKLPRGYNGQIKTTGSVLHAVVIKGELTYEMPVSEEKKVLDPGSYFGSTDNAIHKVTNQIESILYIRTNGEIEVD